MRASPLLLSLMPVFALACNGSSSAAPHETGDGGGGDAGATFEYTPAGCSYSYAPPALLKFTALALDDEGAVSATDGAPQRVRLGLGGGVTKGSPGYADPSTMAAFTWETAEADHAAKVKLGTSPSALTDVHTGYVWDNPQLGASAIHMHEVHVCGLQPGTTYTYQVGGGPAGKEVWGAPQTFTTLPASGSITIGVSGDARDTLTTWQMVHSRMRSAGAAMQLIGGDVVDLGIVESLYQQWLDAIWKDPADSTKFLTLGQQMILAVDGNHEAESPNSFSAWALPGVAGDPYAETHASFDVGSAHVVMLDDQQIATIATGVTNAEASAQLAWLDKDLAAAAADRSKHPFIVVISHRGMFSTSLHSTDSDVLAVRGALTPIYDKYAVDLVINGHDHEYERSKPLTAGSPPSGDPHVGSGTTYVICAGAGADPYAVAKVQASYSSGVQQAFCTSLTDPNCAAGSKYIGVYSLLTLTPTQLTLKAYGLRPSATTYADDDVIDTVTLSPH